MKLSDEDQKNHPQLTQYVRYSMPQVINVGVIVKAVHEHGLLSVDEFKKALTWGEPPLIKIADSSVVKCGTVNSWYGCNRNDQEIEVDLETVTTFEKGGIGANVDKNAAGKNVYLLGVTLLHELCHWGHKLKKTAETAGHAGDLYEKAAYGRVLG